MARKRLAIILKMRPILILNLLRYNEDYDIQFILSGQHYSDNLIDVL